MGAVSPLTESDEKQAAVASTSEVDLEVKRLSEMGPVEYDRARGEAAERLGIRCCTLDKLVSDQCNDNGKDLRGSEIKLYEPEPWPLPVNGAAVLDDALGCIEKFMVIRREYAVQSVLWAAHTHIFDIFMHSPRLVITAPEAECGKTVLLQIVGAMVPRPQPVEIMKAAPFFRMTEKFKPIWLIDECDVFIRDDDDLMAALNNGWEPHGGVIRCVGEDLDPRKFSTFTPVAVGGIKLQKILRPATLSRSFVIELERARNGEIKEPYDSRSHRPSLLEIGRKLARWAQEHRELVGHLEPQMPQGSFNRRADKWRPLFAIAQTAGGNWPAYVKNAYFAEEKENKQGGKQSIAVQLLTDIKEILRQDENGIHTSDLIDRLSNLDESPWADYNFKERDPERRKIRPAQLSELLKPYKITPGDIKLQGNNRKGYKRIPFEMAWDRYLSPNS